MKHFFYYLWNLYPPFLGAGIVISKISKDRMSLKVTLKKRPWTLNIVSTQFGGSICAMTDPFYMTLFMIHLGKGYIVWDKSATVNFLKPGRTALNSIFSITPEEVASVKRQLETEHKVELEKDVEVLDVDGVIVAHVRKTIYIRKK